MAVNHPSCSHTVTESKDHLLVCSPTRSQKIRKRRFLLHINLNFEPTALPKVMSKPFSFLAWRRCCRNLLCGVVSNVIPTFSCSRQNHCTDPNKNEKNLWSQCTGQGTSAKTQFNVWLRSHPTAGHSVMDSPAALMAIPRTHCHVPQLRNLSSFLELDL